MCNVTGEQTEWVIGHAEYGVNALLNGILTGYSVNGNNLIVENIMMNDSRNGSEYQCLTVNDMSNPTFLYVAGEYQYRRCEVHYLTDVCTYV